MTGDETRNRDQRPHVIVTRRLPKPWIEPLAEHCRLTWGRESGGWTPELIAALPTATGLLSTLTERIDETILAQAPRLRVVSNVAVGVDNIDVEACTARGLPVGHTPDVLTEATADLAFTLLLATARRLLEAADDARAGRWSTWSPTGWLGLDVFERTLGIIGCGRIGAAVARRARGFAMRVLAAHPRELPEGVVDERVPLNELLARSDFVSIQVPLTGHTRGLIDAAALQTMKPTAILVNTSRGPVIETQALVRALQEGVIAGAGLDVTDPEPLPPEHELYRLPNCVISPHIGSATAATRRRMAQRAVENLLAALAGQSVPYCVNAEALAARAG